MARFMRKGTTKIHFVPTISDPSGPTVSEITAGTELQDELAEITGFGFTNNPIDTPDMGSAFVGKIPDEDTTDNSDLTFYEDDTSNPILTALAKGTQGYIVIFPSGTAGATPAAADVCDVWPATVASNTRIYSAGNEAAKDQVMFTLTSEPSIDAVVE